MLKEIGQGRESRAGFVAVSGERLGTSFLHGAIGGGEIGDKEWDGASGVARFFGQLHGGADAGMDVAHFQGVEGNEVAAGIDRINDGTNLLLRRDRAGIAEGSFVFHGSVRGNAIGTNGKERAN